MGWPLRWGLKTAVEPVCGLAAPEAAQTGKEPFQLHPGRLETSGSSRRSETSRTPRSGQPAQPPVMPSSAPRAQGQEQRDRQSDTATAVGAERAACRERAFISLRLAGDTCGRVQQGSRSGDSGSQPTPGARLRHSQDSSARPHSRSSSPGRSPCLVPPCSAQDGLSGERLSV